MTLTLSAAAAERLNAFREARGLSIREAVMTAVAETHPTLDTLYKDRNDAHQVSPVVPVVRSRRRRRLGESCRVAVRFYVVEHDALRTLAETWQTSISALVCEALEVVDD